VFELVLVVQDGVIGVSVHPDSVDDFEPSMSQATQGIGMTLAFLTMAAVVDLRPRAASEGLLGKEVHGMAQMPVTGPSLVAGPARRIGSGFASAPGHRRGTPQALQSLGSGAEAIPVIADFRQKPWGELRSAPGKEPNKSWSGWRPKSSSMR